MLMPNYRHRALVNILVVDAIRRIFRHAAVLALVATFGLAFAPTVSRAMASQLAAAQPWAELCSAGQGDDAGASLSHCPLCAQAGYTPALPVAEMVARVRPASAVVPFEPAPQPAVTASAWASPPSRAPPSVVLL
jgi:hypothetical protein